MYYTQCAVKAQSHYLSPEPAANELLFWWGLISPRIMTVLSAQEEMLALVAPWAAGVCSQHPQLQHPPPVAKGMEEKSKKREKLVGDSTETAEEDVEVAEDADGRVWGDNKVWVSRYRCHIVSLWRKTRCVFLLIGPGCGFSNSVSAGWVTGMVLTG